MAKCRFFTSVEALTASGRIESLPAEESFPCATLALAEYVPVLPLSEENPLASRLIAETESVAAGLRLVSVTCTEPLLI